MHVPLLLIDHILTTASPDNAAKHLLASQYLRFCTQSRRPPSTCNITVSLVTNRASLYNLHDLITVLHNLQRLPSLHKPKCFICRPFQSLIHSFDQGLHIRALVLEDTGID